MSPLSSLTGPPPVGGVAAIASWLLRVGGSARRVPLPQQLREPAVREVTRRPHKRGTLATPGPLRPRPFPEAQAPVSAHADGSQRLHVTSGVGGDGIGSADESAGQQGLGRAAPGLLGVQAHSLRCGAHRGGLQQLQWGLGTKVRAPSRSPRPSLEPAAPEREEGVTDNARPGPMAGAETREWTKV